MAEYKVLLSKTAVTQLNLLEPGQAARVREVLRSLGTDPFHRRSGTDIRRLLTTDHPPLFRVRIGDYRAIYFVVGDEVRVTEIIHRSRGYKWLE
ncbi:MAG: type II toxin-antitoxin system RelE/ParE family toxin [Candidatus Thorarchaeota archaeon]|nr:type II toxin-antitoxin system RelE/ParE family toxin [Candidatus Thorarchaeota archaeon]